MKNFVAFVLALAFPSVASAGVLHKCIGPTGQTSVQSAPCPADHQTVWTRDVEPETPPNDARERTGPASSSKSKRQAFDGARIETRRTSSPSTRERQRVTCKSAREREAETRRARPNLTYDQLTRLHDRTANACRGL